MTSSIVQPYIDQENPNAVAAAGNRGRLGNLAGRQQLKTFSSGNQAPLATPRRALGNVSNDPSKRALQGITNTTGKKSLLSQKGPAFRKPSMATPGPQGFTSSKKPLKLKLSEGGPTTKAKTAEALANVFVDVFADIEKMHIFDEDKEPSFGLIPDRDCLSRFLDRLGPMRAPLIHHAKTDDVELDFSHMQLDLDARRQQDFGPESFQASAAASSSTLDLPMPSVDPPSLDSCLLNLPPLDSVDFMDLNNFKDLYD